jgi:hypothetical protein
MRRHLAHTPSFISKVWSAVMVLPTVTLAVHAGTPCGMPIAGYVLWPRALKLLTAVMLAAPTHSMRAVLPSNSHDRCCGSCSCNHIGHPHSAPAVLLQGADGQHGQCHGCAMPCGFVHQVAAHRSTATSQQSRPRCPKPAHVQHHAQGGDICKPIHPCPPNRRVEADRADVAVMC